MLTLGNSSPTCKMRRKATFDTNNFEVALDQLQLTRSHHSVGDGCDTGTYVTELLVSWHDSGRIFSTSSRAHGSRAERGRPSEPSDTTAP